jgi:hypothetical protein
MPSEAAVLTVELDPVRSAEKVLVTGLELSHDHTFDEKLSKNSNKRSQ